jgi:hypothetical protein
MRPYAAVALSEDTELFPSILKCERSCVLSLRQATRATFTPLCWVTQPLRGANLGLAGGARRDDRCATLLIRITAETAPMRLEDPRGRRGWENLQRISMRIHGKPHVACKRAVRSSPKTARHGSRHLPADGRLLKPRRIRTGCPRYRQTRPAIRLSLTLATRSKRRSNARPQPRQTE